MRWHATSMGVGMAVLTAVASRLARAGTLSDWSKVGPLCECPDRSRQAKWSAPTLSSNWEQQAGTDRRVA